jgi:hypothetical protein
VAVAEQDMAVKDKTYHAAIAELDVRGKSMAPGSIPVHAEIGLCGDDVLVEAVQQA